MSNIFDITARFIHEVTGLEVAFAEHSVGDRRKQKYQDCKSGQLVLSSSSEFLGALKHGTYYQREGSSYGTKHSSRLLEETLAPKRRKEILS